MYEKCFNGHFNSKNIMSNVLLSTYVCFNLLFSVISVGYWTVIIILMGKEMPKNSKSKYSNDMNGSNDL